VSVAPDRVLTSTLSTLHGEPVQGSLRRYQHDLSALDFLEVRGDRDAIDQDPVRTQVNGYALAVYVDDVFQAPSRISSQTTST
jgi:hypothetical protein